MQNAKQSLCKLRRSKKGFNDMMIIGVITFVFLLTSIAINFVNQEFITTADNINAEVIGNQVVDEAKNVSTLSGFTVLVTVMKLALFDWGNTLALPFWLDVVYTLLAVLFILVIARNIWIGGGA